LRTMVQANPQILQVGTSLLITFDLHSSLRVSISC
jgi:hypothetical protein